MTPLIFVKMEYTIIILKLNNFSCRNPTIFKLFFFLTYIYIYIYMYVCMYVLIAKTQRNLIRFQLDFQYCATCPI